VLEVLLARTIIFKYGLQDLELGALAERVMGLRNDTSRALNSSKVSGGSEFKELCKNFPRSEESSYTRSVAARAAC
jgi:hypothetical protein